MPDPFPFSADVLPEHLLLLSLFNLLHLVVWLAALVIGFRRRWWWGLILLMPLLYPFGLLVLILKRARKMGWVVATHALLLVLWFAAGAYMKSREWHQLLAAEEALLARGEVLDPARLYNAPEVVPDKNVWDHPLLITLAEAGQSDDRNIDDILDQRPSKPDAGKLARERMEKEYGWMALPSGPPQDLRFAQAEKRPSAAYQALQALYELAWAQKYEEDLLREESDLSEESFENLESLLNALKPSYETHKGRYSAIVEAFKREQDVYPFAFENGPAMLLPHLGYIKKLAQVTRQRILWEAYAREADAAFQTMQDMFVIHRAGMSDVLICRLVEMACWKAGLEGLVAIQNKHLWSDDQWRWMASALAEIRLEKGIPGAMDMERSAFVPWLKEQADENVLQVISVVDALGGPGQRPFSPAQRLWMGPLGFWVQYPMQAFYIKQIRLLHHSYDYLGKEAENIVDQFQHRPWSELEAQLPDYDDREFGLLSAILTPALRVYDRFYSAQLMVEIAKASVPLERFYLKHGRYPEQLEDLVPEFCDVMPQDPMSSQPFHYRRLGSDGFELYSVGWNGKDEGGFPGLLPVHWRDRSWNYEDEPDDVLWRVEGREETFPVVLREPEDDEDESSMMQDIEMMKRYGLLPEGFDDWGEDDLEEEK